MVWVLTAVINSVMLGQNAEPVNASSPESPALQTAVAAPATKNESLSDKTDQKDSRGWLPPGEDPENRLICTRMTGNGSRPLPDSPAP